MTIEEWLTTRGVRWTESESESEGGSQTGGRWSAIRSSQRKEHLCDGDFKKWNFPTIVVCGLAG